MVSGHNDLNLFVYFRYHKSGFHMLVSCCSRNWCQWA